MPDRSGADAPPDSMPSMGALLAAGAAARAVSTPPDEPVPGRNRAADDGHDQPDTSDAQDDQRDAA